MTDSPASRDRIAALDGLRGIAVSWVIISHANMSFGPLPGWKLLASGWMGVDIFFALSGYLITGILLDTRESRGYFKNFYARRALRIFPLYWGFLALALFVLPATRFGELAQLEHQPWPAVSSLFLYYYNIWAAFAQHGVSGLQHFWTLCIEEQFYLIWPMIVRCTPAQRIGRVCVLGALLSMLARLMAMHLLGPPFAWDVTPSRLDALFLGAWAANARRDPELWARTVRAAKLVLPAGTLVLVALSQHLEWLHPWSAENFKYGISIVALASTAAVVQLVDGRGVFARVCELRILRMLGARSYAMYVLQNVVIFPLASLAPSFGAWSASEPGRTALAWSCVMIAYLAAELSFWLYERPFLRLKRLFDEPAG